MIYETLSCIADEINKYFNRQLYLSEDKVVLSAIVNQDGSVAIQGENKVVLTLINVEKESLGINATGFNNGNVTTRSMPLVCINLYILFAAYFSSNNYAEALRFLSFIIAYFQSRNVLTSANTPSLDKRIDKLMFEMESVGTERLNNVWATLGAKYMPSVIYKMRMLTFDDGVIREYRPGVTNPSATI